MILSAVLSTVPEGIHRLIPQVIIFVPRRKIQQQEGNPPLLLEIFHKRDLVLVDVCLLKLFRVSLFGIEADGNALYSADVINGTLLFKISQRDMTALFVHFDRGNRRWDFLDQGQMIFTVPFIGTIDKFFKCRTTQPSLNPGWNYKIPRCVSSGSS